ncbi:VOC family protein [Microbacterium sp. JB110]|uniref:VOC family protein n=1 Tax=Microbacterium sp. JB110 TaxID=2024477 RepID=UPI00097EB972|nr:VOC family protein [Microbacterium sp. JB110]RCS63181.1 VOC family protein [Microbacterium sp. JB110]SJM52612.1 possible cell wall protein [Frigoribacterium sp. JB110]
MFENSDAFSGMSSDDIAASHTFYEDVLGLTVKDEGMGGLISVQLPKGGAVLIYPKENHEPATFTILNFPVDDVDAAVDELVAKGVAMLRYDGFEQDEKGIARGRAAGYGPDIAWFTDPVGNILSVLTV